MAINVLQHDNNCDITASVLAINFVCGIRVGYIVHSLTHVMPLPLARALIRIQGFLINLITSRQALTNT